MWLSGQSCNASTCRLHFCFRSRAGDSAQGAKNVGFRRMNSCIANIEAEGVKTGRFGTTPRTRSVGGGESYMGRRTVRDAVPATVGGLCFWSLGRSFVRACAIPVPAIEMHRAKNHLGRGGSAGGLWPD